ncbi:hypothetical protein B0H13DRAFT_2281908 [Mycena leptocephala]|nr:hypothetical protein B0H13DRAFT_2281908 [Mycena leptocephala]
MRSSRSVRPGRWAALPAWTDTGPYVDSATGEQGRMWADGVASARCRKDDASFLGGDALVEKGGLPCSRIWLSGKKWGKVKESLSKDAWEEKRSNVAVRNINATVGKAAVREFEKAPRKKRQARRLWADNE